MKITSEQLKARMNYPLELKIEWAKNRVREFYRHNDGKVYVAFSGGKDSTVLLHIVRSVYPEVEAVFADTGLEYPEIKQFVNTFDNVTIVRPVMPFNKVIEKYGYPVVSKNVSRYVRDLQNPSSNNQRTKDIRLGLTGSAVGTLSKKWRYLVDAPFKCSEQCCDVMKKNPMKKYQKQAKKFPIIGTMVGESSSRKLVYLRVGCFNENKNQLNPISIFTEEDIWAYIKKFNLDYSKIYDMGEKRTGCMFCMFGVTHEKTPNRFQRMKKTHPVQYKYCMGKLGCGEVLDFIGVEKE